MRCAICGKSDEAFKIYILSWNALKKFFKLMGDKGEVLLFAQEAHSNQPLHVCNECLKFGRYY